MKVRKKTYVVDAWHYDDDNRHNIIRILDKYQQEFMPYGKQIILQTRDGELTISPGDYLIRGHNGNFYNCKAEIFNDNYEIKGVHFE